MYQALRVLRAPFSVKKIRFELQKPSRGQVSYLKNDRFSRLYIYWIQKKQKQAKYILLGFQGASSSILTFNCGPICQHLLFVQYKTKFVDLKIFLTHFQTLKSINFWTQFFVIQSIHKHSLGSCQFPHTIWARFVQQF